MVAQRWGWLHRADGDGGDALHWSDITTSSSCGHGGDVRTPFEGSAVLFRGCGAPAVQEWVVQCHGVDTGLTAQRCTVAGMDSQGGLAKQHRDMIPGRVRGPAWRGFALDPGARGVSEHLMLRSGEWARGRRTHERGGVSVVRRRARGARWSFGRGVSGPTA
jgi:hypothetical protein